MDSLHHFFLYNTLIFQRKSNVLQDSVLYGHLKDFGYFVFPYMKQLLSLAS